MKKITGKKAFIIKCIPALLLALTVFSGCGAMRSFAVSEIEYDGKTYTHLYDWKINDDAPFEKVVIDQDNMSLECNVYDSGGQTEFIYWSESGELFHDSQAELPEPKAGSVESISAEYNDPDNNKSTSDPEIISELCDILSHEEFTENPGDVEYICAVGISYKDCPATNWCINLNKDKDDRLFITQFNFNLPDKNPNHSKIFKAPENSKLYRFVTE